VAPGKGFTKTCKGGVVVLIGGYALLQLIPGSINYLAIIPAKYYPALLLKMINSNMQF
jgi:hypothetical protein